MFLCIYCLLCKKNKLLQCLILCGGNFFRNDRWYNIYCSINYCLYLINILIKWNVLCITWLYGVFYWSFISVIQLCNILIFDVRRVTFCFWLLHIVTLGHFTVLPLWYSICTILVKIVFTSWFYALLSS